jgi:maltose-binding protein MalE
MKFFGTALNYAKTRPNSTLYPVISEKIMNALAEYISGAKTAEKAFADAEAAVLREMN